MTTFATLATTPSTPASVTPKRNRHTPENDAQSALIKRINRRYAKNKVNRKVVVRNGGFDVIRLTEDVHGPAGEYRMTIGSNYDSLVNFLQHMA